MIYLLLMAGLFIQDGWTPRWTPLREHGVEKLTGQRKDYRFCEKRFIVVAAGGRSMKTEIGKRKVVEKFCTNVFISPNGNIDKDGKYDERYFIAAPTTGQAKEIAWQDIRAFVPSELIAHVNYSELYIQHICGPRLYILGMDKPQRWEGRPWNYGLFTEFADMKLGMWAANIRPALADRLGGCILEGRPDFDKPNNEDFERLFQKGLSGDPEWGSFQWHSKEVLDPGELEEAYSTMPPELVDQEFGGNFVKAPGRAYGGFARSEHVRDDKAEYDPTLPVYVSCDFNGWHHNWGLYQCGNDRVYRAFDEIYILGGSVEQMCKDLGERLDGLRIQKNAATLRELDVCFFGDYSGQQKRPEASHTAWQQVKSAFPFAEYMYRLQPPISDRINLMNGTLRNVAGEIHLYIHSRCKNLIRDCERVSRTMLFSQDKTSDLTHASDNCGYMLHQTQREFKRSDLMSKLRHNG